MSLGGLSRASATVVTYTVTGTVSSEVDPKNLFEGVDLVGESFTEVQTFNLAQAEIALTPPFTIYEGGSVYGTPSIGNSTLTAGSFTAVVPGNFASALVNHPGFYAEIQGQDSGLNKQYTDLAFISEKITDGITPLAISLAGTSSGGFYRNDVGGQESFLNLNALTLTITTDAVSPVPIPASLPMFGAALIGFGALGYGMKKRTAKFERSR